MRELFRIQMENRSSSTGTLGGKIGGSPVDESQALANTKLTIMLTLL